MEVRFATPNDFDLIKKIVHSTIETVYSSFYPQDVVQFFLDHHSDESIISDINSENVFMMDVENSCVGTGTIRGNEIFRVFVLPEFQRKGYGTQIMKELEAIIARTSKTVRLDSSLPAYNLYLRLGYKPFAYRMISTPNGQVLCYHEMKKQLSPADASPEAYPVPHFANRVFVMVSEDSDLFGDAKIIMHQDGLLVWADFEGRLIMKGLMLGRAQEDSSLELTYSIVDSSFNMRTGKCSLSPSSFADGRLRLTGTCIASQEEGSNHVQVELEEVR